MKLYIVRHAWAVEPDDPDYPDDAQRPLTQEGRVRFAHFTKKLGKRGMTPSRIATSPLVRCRQTAAILHRFLPHQPRVSVRDELAPGADLEKILRWSSSYADDDLAWVGHAPDVDRLVAALIGSSAAQVDFGKGAVAAISFAGRLGPGWGVLDWFVHAKLLGC